MKKIACFHLLNDYSGSPIVLKMVLRGLLNKGYHIDLVSSSGGVLDELGATPLLKRHTYRYQFSTRAILTMLRYTAVQIYTFFLSFRFLPCRGMVFYINTLLPVGPALAARIMGKRVVYHYHENADAKGKMYQTLCWLMQRLAHQIICVSAYQASFLKRKNNVTVISNAIPAELAERFQNDTDRAFDQQNVLMLSSLKSYKGTAEFIRLAQKMPQYRFTLVINDTQAQIENYLAEQQLTVTPNLSVFPRQEDVAPFYNQASIVLNLSHKSLFIETFGLTALEAMTAGLPVIVPTVGGIAEMVEDDVNGYKIDVDDMDRIEEAINTLLTDKELYSRLAKNARTSSKLYGENTMIEKIAKLLDV